MAMLIALETGMRSSEIVYISKDWVQGASLRIPDTKNDSVRNVPMERFFSKHHSQTVSQFKIGSKV